MFELTYWLAGRWSVVALKTGYLLEVAALKLWSA
jgi:hypothetical protein